MKCGNLKIKYLNPNPKPMTDKIEEGKMTLEKNKMIAEFEGKGHWECWRKNFYKRTWVTEYPTKLDCEIAIIKQSNNIFNIDTHEAKFISPEYHSDWNHLMRVVEKIRSIHSGNEPSNHLLSYKVEMIVHAKSNQCKISKTYWPRSGEYKEEMICGKNLLTSLIEAVYSAVCAFIEWYNKQKK